jgi:hypothetical protein
MFTTGKTRNKAHRIAYELTHGAIPAGLDICHTCDNRKCCNPSHLFLGTRQDNIDDMLSKNREARGESSGRYKITDKQVEKMRALSSVGVKQSILAEKYGVTDGHVSRVLRFLDRRKPTNRKVLVWQI